LKIFRQILKVAPDFYWHKWVKIEGQRDYSLLIDIPHNIEQILEANVMFFRILLIQF
jgi:hypothetical protein